MRTSIVTGGGRGIGLAIAKSLGGRNTTVVVTGRTRRDLVSAAREIGALGGKTLAVTMDVSDPKSVGRGMTEVRRSVGRIDVLVNNAGVGGGERVVGSDVSRWRKTIDTNLVGMYLMSREVVPTMRPGGRIVNLSSVLGRFGVPGTRRTVRPSTACWVLPVRWRWSSLIRRYGQRTLPGVGGHRDGGGRNAAGRRGERMDVPEIS